VRHADSTAARLARRQDNPTRALGDERVRKVLNRHRHIRVTSFENSGLLEESELEQALRERHRSDRAHDLNETFRRDLDRDPLDEHHDLCDTRLLRRLGHDGLLGAWTADGGANGPEIADRPASRFFAHGDRGRGLAAGDRHKIVEGALQRVAECGEDVETHPLRRLRHQPIDLLSGEAGHKIVGWSGLVILVLLGTGLAAWWPKGSWRKAVAYKRQAAPIRRLHDLHKLTGLWSLLLLILFAGTGFMLALPKESNWVMERAITPVDPVPSPQSIARPGSSVSLMTALAAGHHAMPDARLAWIEVPPPGTGVIKLRVQVPGDPSRRFPHSYIYIDQYSGAVIDVLDARKGGAATTINNWLHPLHDASVGGLPTRTLAFIVGLAPAALFITGLLRWRKRRARLAPNTQNPVFQGVS